MKGGITVTRHPLRLAAFALAIGAFGAGLFLLRTESGQTGYPLLVPLSLLVVAGLVGLLGRALGHLRRWGLLVGAGAYVAMAALLSFELGLGAMVAGWLWALHDAHAELED